MIAYISKQGGELREFDGQDDAVWINVYPPFEHGELDGLATAMDVPLDFITDSLDIDEIKTYGPMIENYRQFPNRINVQFAKIIDRKLVEILIWERGAGFTLASGSSSCAVASVLRKKGLIDREVVIKMLGGQLVIDIDDKFNVRMTGEVKQICEGILSDELITEFTEK